MSVYLRVVINTIHPFTQLWKIYLTLETQDKLWPSDAPKSSVRLLSVLKYAHLNSAQLYTQLHLGYKQTHFHLSRDTVSKLRSKGANKDGKETHPKT